MSELAFQYARARFKDIFSIMMGHDELWTSWSMFELRFNNRNYYFDADIGLVAKVCCVLTPMPFIVELFLLEDAHRNYWQMKPDCDGRDVTRCFGCLITSGHFAWLVDS